MKAKLQIGLLSALLLSSTALAANAQSFRVDTFHHFGDRFDRDRDGIRDDLELRDNMRFRHGLGFGYGNGWHNGWRNGWHNGWGNGWGMDRSLSMREAQFNSDVLRLRNRIASLRARQQISFGEAARLNARLDNLVALEANMRADGRLSTGELASLEARLNNVEVAVRGNMFY